MKKIIIAVSSIVLAALILINLYSLVIWSFFVMPVEMKKETVCFFAPGLTWDSTFSDAKKCFGDPIEKGVYNNVTATVSNTFRTEYDDCMMTVYATRGAFSITELMCKKRVFRYSFAIDCTDEKEEKEMYNKICDELIKSKEKNDRFVYEKSEMELTASIWYGAVGIGYDVEYDEKDDEKRVFVYANAQY